MPAQPAYITRNRHGTFYFRIVVPSPLRTALGLQREIRRSLRTDSQRLALRRARQFTARYEAVFDRFFRMAGRDDEFSVEEYESLLGDLEKAGSAEAWGAWSSGEVEPAAPSQSALTDEQWQEIEAQQRRSEIARALTGSSTRAIPQNLRELADLLFGKSQTLPLPRFRQVLPKLIDEIALQQLTPIDSTPVPTIRTAATQDAPTIYELWEQHWEKLATLNKVKKVARTQEDERGHACRLNILSGNKPFNRLTQDDLNRMYLQAFEIRTSRGKRLPSPDSAVDSILAKDGEACLAPATVEKLITRLNVLHSFAHQRGMSTVSPEHTDKPVVDLSPEGTKTKEKAFSRSDLKAVFSGYLYAGNDIGSSRALFPFQFWLPLLGLLTGGRLNELCQLDTSDVEQHAESGIWLITIMDDPKDRPVRKMLKNKSSRRVLPIHSELIRMGFLNFVEQARQEGREKLFSDGLRYCEKKGWGGRATHFFCRFPSPSTKAMGYLFSMGIRSRDAAGNTDRKNFHSFRHTFTDMARDAGAEAYLVLPDLTGHSRRKEGMLPNYGNGFTLEKKQAVLDSLQIPVDLSAISYTDFQARLGEVLQKSITSHRQEFGLNQAESAT